MPSGSVRDLLLRLPFPFQHCHVLSLTCHGPAVACTASLVVVANLLLLSLQGSAPEPGMQHSLKCQRPPAAEVSTMVRCSVTCSHLLSRLAAGVGHCWAAFNIVCPASNWATLCQRGSVQHN